MAAALIAPLLHPSPVTLAAVVSIIVVVHLFVERTRNKRDTPLLSKINRTANLLYSLFSLVSLVGAVYALYLDFIVPARVLPGTLLYCADVRGTHTTPWLIVYFWAKLWEGLVDLTVTTLRGIPTHIHFRVHHYTTPIFAWLGWYTGSAHGYCFMLLNLYVPSLHPLCPECLVLFVLPARPVAADLVSSTMHVFVYAWHGGVRIPILFRVIRLWQSVQLHGGTLLCLLALSQRLQGRPCRGDDSVVGFAADVVPALLFQVYYQLFLIEVREFEASTAAKRN